MTSRVGQREAATPTKLRQRKARGELRGDERAFVHVGKQATDVLIGNDDLSSWTENDLIKGYKGTGVGRSQHSEVVPKKLHDELVRRKMLKAHQLLGNNLVKAVETLVEIATDGQSEDKDRIKAASIIIERVMGKTPERIAVSVDSPWLQVLQAGIVSVQNTADAVDAEGDEDD